MNRLLIVGAAAAALLLGGSSASALRLPAAPHCTIFPATNTWNQRVDQLPVAANSAQLIASIGATTGLHPDFGSGLYDGRPIGIPFDVVSKKTPRSRVTFDYADESDKLRYPIPKTVHIEGGRASSGDRHALLLDKDACRLYELYALYPSGGGWKAGSGATWSLRSNAVRPAGWTSADAAGLPIFPGQALRRRGVGVPVASDAEVPGHVCRDGRWVDAGDDHIMKRRATRFFETRDQRPTLTEVPVEFCPVAPN